MCVDQIPGMAKFETHWAIAKGLGFVPDQAVPRRHYTEFEKNPAVDKQTLKKFRAFVRAQKPDVAVSFQCPWWVNYALWREGVKVRAGVRSQWHSYLFLNKGLRQKRSRALRHEADYNRELLEFALGLQPDTETPVLRMKAKENPELLKKHGLKEKKYAVVHPGMAGSALNWPIANYIEFIERKLQRKTVNEAQSDFRVVLSGTAADESWLRDIKKHFAKEPLVINLQGQLRTEDLLTVLEKAETVLAPSTGIAHLAASLGTKTVAIYSPIQVQHPRRWAARGRDVHILVPPLVEPVEKSMEQITVAQALDA